MDQVANAESERSKNKFEVCKPPIKAGSLTCNNEEGEGEVHCLYTLWLKQGVQREGKWGGPWLKTKPIFQGR